MIISVVKKLNYLLTRRDKQLLACLFLFSIVISIIEMIGVSAIMPFMSVVMNFSLIETNHYYSFFYNYYSFKNQINFILTFGALLICFYFVRSFINYVYFYGLARFANGRYYLLANRLFKNYLELPYSLFTKKNSSELTKTIISEAQLLTQLLSALLLLFSEINILILIYIMLIYINYKLTLLLTLLLISNALLMIKTVSKKIKKVGVQRENLQRQFYEIINKSLNNFKFIKLLRNEHKMLQEFNKVSFSYSQAGSINESLSQVPRLFLEGLGFSIILLIIMILVWKDGNDIGAVLAVISIFTLSLYRMLPSVNRILTSYNTIVYNHRSLDIIHKELMYQPEIIGDEQIIFTKKILISNISFEYKKTQPILENISCTIYKGESIGIIGESGSGKSTFVDVLMGLYKINVGSINIDGIELTSKNIGSWRKKIGYIPQSVYLFDGTIGANVALGHVYNEQKIKQCLKLAKLFDYLEKYNGLETIVGENGIMLSGGQKQRVAIARALYGEPEILVLDEATSALDSDTESEIMNSIYELGKHKTLIIIAHRLSSLKKCNRILEVKNGCLLESKKTIGLDNSSGSDDGV